MIRFNKGETIAVIDIADITMGRLGDEARKLPQRSKQRAAMERAVGRLDKALFRGEISKIRTALIYCIERIGEPLLAFWNDTYKTGVCGYNSVSELIHYND